MEYDTVIRLSSALVADEYETAQQLFDGAKGDESLLRASGIIGRVALERHLFNVADSKQVAIRVNPPTKKKPDIQDVINRLEKSGVITPIQKSEIESLFKIGNNCAHPKEAINARDIRRLLEEAKELSAVVV